MAKRLLRQCGEGDIEVPTKQPRVIASRLADRALSEAGYAPVRCRPVPLINIMRALRLKRRPASEPSAACLWEPGSQQIALFGDAEISVGTAGLRRRFIIAHEMAHQAARLYLASEETLRWSPQDWHTYCQEFAGRLILPDALLLGTVGTASPLHLTIAGLAALQRAFRVPMACLLKRLNDASTQGLLTLTNCAFLAAPGLSLRRQRDYAPRVVVSCMPREWFVPANKRLYTLGLLTLARAFWSAEPLVPGTLYDHLHIWHRRPWRQETLQLPFRYVIYPARPGPRVMLAVFPAPGSSACEDRHHASGLAS